MDIFWLIYVCDVHIIQFVSACRYQVNDIIITWNRVLLPFYIHHTVGNLDQDLKSKLIMNHTTSIINITILYTTKIHLWFHLSYKTFSCSLALLYKRRIRIILYLIASIIFVRIIIKSNNIIDTN